VPSEAGFTSTRPAPYSPINWCGNVLLMSGTRIRFFFADSMPFLIAERHFARLAGAEADVSTLVAYHNERRRTKGSCRP
jgi:hypothetical protein